MKKKNLNLLGGLTVVVLIAAFFAVQSRSTTKAAPDGRGEKLFEGLTAKLNDVSRLAVTSGADTLTIRRDGTSWNVVESHGYPAKFDRVKETLVNVANLEIEEPKTKKAEFWAQLGVEDPGAADAKSKRVVLSDEAGTVLADVIVGNPLYRSGGDRAVYVRKGDGDQAFLCRGTFNLATDPMSWIERNVLSVQSREVTRVTVEHADGERLELTPQDPSGADFRLASVPAGRMAKERAGDSIASSLASVYLDDVRPVAEVDFGSEPVLDATWRKSDGEAVKLTLAKAEDKTWARFAFSYESPAAPEPAESDEAEAERTALELATRKRVDERNRTIAPWAFAIPSYKANNISQRTQDLLVPLEEPVVGPPAGATGAGGAGDPGAETDDLLESLGLGARIDPAVEELFEEPATEDPPAEPAEPPGDGAGETGDGGR